jgi:uncharacterized protein
MNAAESLRALKDELQPYTRIGVAFSGGVDSATLLGAAAQILGKDNVIAFLGVSESLARREKEIALSVARDLGVQLVEIETKEFLNPQYLANDGQRCYFCKESLFTAIHEYDFAAFDLDALAYGENADDSIRKDRPGQRAAGEFGVIRPLSAAQMSKSDVRELARHLDIAVAEKPASPCLASRIKPFTQVTRLALKQVEVVEDFLLNKGFTDVRARYLGDSLMVEVPSTEQVLLSNDALRSELDSLRLINQLPLIEFSEKPLASGSFSHKYLESAHV